MADRQRNWRLWRCSSIISKELKFKIVPQFERYYSEDSNFGVYTFLTEDELPESEEYDSGIFDENCKKRMSTLSGNMQRLYLGSEYEVTASLTYSQKYKSFQYTPKIVSAIAPKSFEQQKLFLESLVTEKQAAVILEQYPNVIEDVLNNKPIDIGVLRGIGDHTWDNIKEKIISNYAISDILILLQPLGVSFNMIKKLLSYERNPALLKKKLIKNPYIMTKVPGLGFKMVDSLALKLNPEIRVSDSRTYAFLLYYLNTTGESAGHTWVTQSILENAVRDNINDCMEIYHSVLQEEKLKPQLLFQKGNKVGLLRYYRTEKSIFEILKSLNGFKKDWKVDFDKGIAEAEAEQGFKLTDEQTEIIRKSANDNVFIVSGFAGVGKTSIARALLKAYKLAGYSIACCALSAKAAQRITEATGYPASTIHRLLGVENGCFYHNHKVPLTEDVIFIDECSMINSDIFHAVLLAVKEGSKVLLFGDNRQLPPIGYGNIFSDLLDMTETFNINKLTKVLRQAEKSGILSDANKIREGICPVSQPELKIVTGELQDMLYMFRDNREALRNIAVKTYLKAVQEDGLDDVVIITPRKKDCVNSTQEINAIIQDELIPKSTESMQYGKRTFRVGAKVIQRVNNYAKNIFNGEIGYITKIWDEIRGKEKITKFEVEYKLGEVVKQIQYTRAELEQIDLAYALTCHLSQGSGYKTVIVIIDNTHYTLLDTCLLYTALTRAKQRCLLLAEPSAFKKCINSNNSVNRQTWLKEISVYKNKNKEVSA